MEYKNVGGLNMHKKWVAVTAGLLLTLIFAAGCSNKDTVGASPSNTIAPSTPSTETAQPSAGTSSSPSSSPVQSPSDEGQKLILEEFQELLKTAGNEKAAITKMQQVVSTLSPEYANQMILAFEAYQMAAITQAGVMVDDELIKLIQKAPEPYNEKILNDLTKITDTDLKNALQAIFDKGYKIIVPEGMYDVIIDYGIYQDAGKSATPDIAAYIGIMATESDLRMLEDAAIIVPIDEVFARALASESFLITYPDSVKFDQVEQRYMNYVDTFFFGQNNTPAFDYETHKLNQEFLDSYTKAAKSGKDSTLVTAVNDYLAVLTDNDYTLTTVVTEYRKSITNGLKNTAS